MELLLFVLLGHVCLVGLGIADLVEVIRDHRNDIPFARETLRSHVHVTVFT